MVEAHRNLIMRPKVACKVAMFEGFCPRMAIIRWFLPLTCTIFVALPAVWLAGCKHSASSSDTRIKIGLVLDKGGKDDKSFNTAAYRGAKQAEKELGFKLKDVETMDDAAFEPALRTFAERKYPLVIAIGFSQLDAVQKVAASFPEFTRDACLLSSLRIVFSDEFDCAARIH